jgi:hypothetical protein
MVFFLSEYLYSLVLDSNGHVFLLSNATTLTFDHEKHLHYSVVPLMMVIKSTKSHDHGAYGLVSIMLVKVFVFTE